MQRQRVRVDGGAFELEVWQAGQGPPLVFLHGEEGPRWGAYLDLLADSARVVAPVLPGYTSSGGAEHVRDQSDFVYALLDLLDALELRAFPLIGHGLGGMLAAELAAMQPERLSHLVLIDAFGLWLADQPTLDYFAASPPELAVALYRHPEARAAQAALAMPTEVEAQVAYQLERARSRASAAKCLWPIPNRGLDRRLHRVRMPTLIIWGEHDGVLPPGYARAFASRLADARVEIVADAAHLPHEECPEAVAALTRSFVESEVHVA